MIHTTVRTPERSTSKSKTASTRRRSLRIADVAVTVGLIASYYSPGIVVLHAVVSLLWSAAVGWHVWLHRKWFRSVARRLAKTRSWRSRGSAMVTMLITAELTVVVLLGILAWLGPRSLKGVHGTLGTILLFIALAHVAFNARHLKALIRRRSTVIDRRFRGSENMAQRGYAAGRIASHAEGIVKVEFRGSPRVDEELIIEVDSEEHVTVFQGSDIVMAAAPDLEGVAQIPAPLWVIAEVFERVSVVAAGTPDRPHCFGCSPDRTDGLAITTSLVGTTGFWGSTWTPHESLPSTAGFVDDEVIWAALDCPGSFAASGSTGRWAGAIGAPCLDAMTVQILEKVRIGKQVAVLGWTLAHTDSTVDCGTAIVGRDGQVKAYARLCHTISEEQAPHGK